MDMSEEKRVQVTMSKELRNALRDWAAEVSKANDEEVGLGSLSGQLLEELSKHPELIQQLLFAKNGKIKLKN